MKKLFPIALIAACALMVTSCSKNYTCTCTYTDGAGLNQTNTGSIHGTKSQAQSACTTSANDLKDLGETNVSCHL